MTVQEVSFLSEGERLAAALFLPAQTPAPAIIFAHGVFEFKEDFFDVDEHFHTAPRLVDAFEHVPFPGVWNGFVVDIRDELPRVQAPTLVIHGAQDQMEPVGGARVLYETLTCEKERISTVFF